MNNKYLFADISDYQATFDALKYRSARHDLIAIKAGEGDGHGGASHYVQRVQDAHTVDLVVWHYWYLQPDVSIRTQASLFAETIRPYFGHRDRIVIDTESLAVSPEMGGALAIDMRTAMIAMGHPHGIIYSYPAYVTEAMYEAGVEYWIAEPDGSLKLTYEFGLNKKFNVRWKQFTDSTHGHLPHSFAGIGPCDGSVWL